MISWRPCRPRGARRRWASGRRGDGALRRFGAVLRQKPSPSPRASRRRQPRASRRPRTSVSTIALGVLLHSLSLGCRTSVRLHAVVVAVGTLRSSAQVVPNLCRHNSSLIVRRGSLSQHVRRAALGKQRRKLRANQRRLRAPEPRGLGPNLSARSCQRFPPTC